MTKKYILGGLIVVLSFALFVAPFLILLASRYDDWVVVADGFSIATGVLIGIGYMVLIMKGALKRVAPLVSLLVTSLVLTIVILFLDTIIQDLFWVMGSVTLGLALFIVTFKIGMRIIEKAKIYTDEKVRVQARQDSSSAII